jgi:hypothetical protein
MRKGVDAQVEAVETIYSNRVPRVTSTIRSHDLESSRPDRGISIEAVIGDGWPALGAVAFPPMARFSVVMDTY